MTKQTKKPLLLCILDGWGCRDAHENNAIKSAHTPNLDLIEKKYPQSKLMTSGLDVGLPEGQMGNSEVGHMTIGSGRIIYQLLPRIDKSIEDGSIGKIKELRDLIAALKKTGGACHLMGLVSDGGVHAHISHIIALSEIIAESGVPVNIHAFLDGRDTPPESASGYIAMLMRKISHHKNIKIATISGRYYPMDRDKRWERVELAYDAMVLAHGPKTDDPIKAIEESYKAGKSDEFIFPTIVAEYKGMKDGDGILMANFRSDRARQILSALLDPEFDGFARKKIVSFPDAAGMVEYSDRLNEFLSVLFPTEVPKHTLGQIMADRGLKQLRIAETEKYAHVTFFLNGGAEDVFEGEDRILVPSPKIATYDQKPEMSAPEVTEKLVAAIESGKYDFIVVNYANGDMVGHTGDMKAAMKAVEAVDDALGKVSGAVLKQGGIMMITADHGNAECMVDPETGEPHTAHTLNPVPFILIGAGENITLKDGRLSDIAPTILNLMNIPVPGVMTGKILVS